MRFLNSWKLLSVVIMSLFVAACAPKVSQRGHADMQEKIMQIKAGESHKQDVMRLLGSPSTTSNFGTETWYYIQARYLMP